MTHSDVIIGQVVTSSVRLHQETPKIVASSGLLCNTLNIDESHIIESVDGCIGVVWIHA